MNRRVVRPSVEREVDEEFAHHVELLVRDLMADGWCEGDARREAARRFGDVERWKADCRELGTRRDEEMDRRLWWDEFRQDLRYAARQLRRAPSFAAVTILTLGIAIGANTAVFSVVDAVILEPLPYPESEDLSVIWARYLPPSGFDIYKFALSGPEALDFREGSRAAESTGIFSTGSRALTGEGETAERIRVGFYSVDMIPTMGVQPELGRAFTPEEDVSGGPAVTILSHSIWAGRYGSDPAIIGRSILMNGVPTEVIGVMPEGFEFPSESRAWLPLGLGRENEGGRASHGYQAISRLAPGMTQADLDSELEVLADRWAGEYEHNVAHFLWAEPLHTAVVGDAPGRLKLLMAAVGLVLLVACANIANLLLARGERRQGEVAVRRTLGAGRRRITMQLITESLMLAGLAAVVGLGLAKLGLVALTAMDPEALPRLGEVRLDLDVLLFTLGITALTAVLFGVLPAYLAGRRATATLASSSRRSVGGRHRTALRRVLVTGEVAVSLVVVILAGLVARGFGALTATDPGIDPSDVVTFSVTFPTSDYPNDATVPAEFERMLDALRATPGVAAATATTDLPFSGTGQWDFQLNDRPARQDGEVAWNAGISHVTDDYFETMGIPILEGRALDRTDRRGGPLVAVVSETMARRFWPDERVIGKQFGYLMGEDSIPWITIVGLVPDPFTSTLDAEPYPHVYVPQAQGGIATYFVPRSMQVAVRGGVPSSSLMESVRSTMVDFDADLPLYQISTMNDIVASSFAGPRVTTNLLGIFAIIALVLAAVGIYGVISYSVAGRTREIGVRVALGAERGQITRLVLAEGARPVVAGVVLGLGGAWFSTRLVEAMLYDVTPTDPVTFATLPLLLLAVGVTASLLPAFRATRIPPTEALREE